MSEHTAEGDFERTGDPAVDDVIARLESLSDEAELSQQVEALTDAHSALQRRLTAADG